MNKDTSFYIFLFLLLIFTIGVSYYSETTRVEPTNITINESIIMNATYEPSNNGMYLERNRVTQMTKEPIN